MNTQTLALARSAWARASAELHGGFAADYLQKDGDREALAIVNRAAVTPGALSDSDWNETARASVGRFVADLAPYGAAAAILRGAIPVALDGDAERSYPVRSGAMSPPGFVLEGDPIPVNAKAFTAVDIGPKRKLASVLTYSAELARRTDAVATLDSMIRAEVAAGLDTALLATTASSGTAVAGLLNGVTALASSTAAGALAAREDLAALAAAVADGGSGRVLVVASPANVARLRVIDPALFATLDVVASAALASTRVVALDPLAMLAALDDLPQIEASTASVLHMESSPTAISASGATDPYPLRSMLQTNTVALRIVLEIAFAKTRSTAVAYVDAADWTLA